MNNSHLLDGGHALNAAVSATRAGAAEGMRKAPPHTAERYFIFIFLLLVTLCYASQSAAAITYTADNRYTYYKFDDAGFLYTSNTYPDAPYANFDQPPDQVSSLTSAGFSASGEGTRIYDGSYPFQSYTYWSVFDITFNLDTNSLFDVSGTLTGANDTDSYFMPGLPDTGIGKASVALYSGTGTDPANIIFTEDISVLGSLDSILFSYSDILAAGDYRFVAIAEPDRVAGLPNTGSFTFVWSQYDLTASISAVPLPAAFWLFGSGMLGLIGMSRRKRGAVAL